MVSETIDLFAQSIRIERLDRGNDLGVKRAPAITRQSIILHPYARAREGVARNVGLQTIKAAIEKAVMQRGSYP